MRLSSKIFVALAVLAGSVFGFTPDASAHLRTAMVAEVAGDVAWLGTPDLDLDDDVPGDFTDIALDACYKTSTLEGLPLGVPGQPQMLEDRCFQFTGLTINAVGSYEKPTSFDPNKVPPKLVLDFGCEAAGVSTAGAGLLGTFYGEFECTEIGGNPLGIAEANGHFHGLSRDTTIAFLGQICDDVAAANLRDTVAGAVGPNPNPAANLGPNGDCVGAVGVDVDGDPTTPAVTAVSSGIKHTLACKGEVVPLPDGLFDTNDPDDGVVDSVGKARAVLECIIA